MPPEEMESLVTWLDLLSDDPSGRMISVSMRIDKAREIVAAMRQLLARVQELEAKP